MSEQADTALDSGNLSDLASFLGDTPEMESQEEDNEAQETADEPTSEEADTGEDADSEQTDEGEEPEEETAPAEEQKITVKIKGSDGVEEAVEFTPEELSKSVLRQRDYTKKTTELAERETQAVEFFTQKYQEVQSQYLAKAEMTRAAIVNMAGLKSEQELAQLAHSDPAAWVAEQQRQRQINAYLSELDTTIQSEKQAAQQQAQQLQQQTMQKQYQKTWEVLEQQKIDKDKLADIYSKAQKSYGFNEQELGNVYDHRLVLMMRDATAYRALQAQKADVTKKVQSAPRMPTRQTPVQTARDQQLEQKFKGGRAKLNDLAALLR